MTDLMTAGVALLVSGASPVLPLHTYHGGACVTPVDAQAAESLFCSSQYDKMFQRHLSHVLRLHLSLPPPSPVNQGLRFMTSIALIGLIVMFELISVKVSGQEAPLEDY